MKIIINLINHPIQIYKKKIRKVVKLMNNKTLLVVTSGDNSPISPPSLKKLLTTLNFYYIEKTLHISIRLFVCYLSKKFTIYSSLQLKEIQIRKSKQGKMFVFNFLNDMNYLTANMFKSIRQCCLSYLVQIFVFFCNF